MKLREVLLNPVIALLEDNTFIGTQAFEDDPPKFDGAYARPVGTFNRLEIWGSKYYGAAYDVYGILDQHRAPRAYIILEPTGERSAWRRAWVADAERGQDLTLTLVNFVTEKLKEHVIIEDSELTSTDSRRLLKKWRSYSEQMRHFKMRLLDKAGNEQADWDAALEAGKVNELSIVLEDQHDRQLPLFGAGKRIITEFKWY